MRLSPSAFNAHLGHMGQKITWRRSHGCPCHNPNSGASKPGCPVCYGRGYFWDAPIPSVIGISHQGVLRQWLQSGRAEAGDAICSIPENSAAYEAGEFDRILLLNSEDRFTRHLIHGAANEKIFLNIQTITRVSWIVGSSIVDGGIPTVAENGNITWSSNPPPAGAQYAVEGTKFTEYFVFDSLPSDRQEHSGARLPIKVVLRNYDLFGRSGPQT